MSNHSLFSLTEKQNCRQNTKTTRTNSNKGLLLASWPSKLFLGANFVHNSTNMQDKKIARYVKDVFYYALSKYEKK